MLSRPWFRGLKNAAPFVFMGHFLFCSLFVHLTGGAFRNCPVGSYLLPLATFVGPGLALTFLAWRGWTKLRRLRCLRGGPKAVVTRREVW